MTDDFVKKWCIMSHRQGVEGLRLGYKGSRDYLYARQKQQIIAWIQQRNYSNLDELREHIEQTYQVNYQDAKSYYDLIKAAGLSWKKSQKSNPKKDLEQVRQKSWE
jgi:putative transposase